MHWRRRLPHWVPDNVEVFVTWRVSGATAWLADPRIAAMVAEAILHGHNSRSFYELLGWVIMPDHVHLVILPRTPLQEIMRWLKAATGNRANHLLGRRGLAFWHREYFDRWIGQTSNSDRRSLMWRTTRFARDWSRAPRSGRGRVRIEQRRYKTKNPAAKTAGGTTNKAGDKIAGPTESPAAQD
jgi:REP element-mobilizing transposase RayT